MGPHPSRWDPTRRYESGLRAIEHLEGAGEPLLWRLVEEGSGGDDELPEAELDQSFAEEAAVVCRTGLERRTSAASRSAAATTATAARLLCR